MSHSPEATALIALLADRPVAYHPMLAKVLGGVKQAIFICQLLYWHDKGKRPDGFIWKTANDIEKETGLSRSEQQTARKHLVKFGVLQEKLKGIPATMHYKINLVRLTTLIVEHSQPSLQEPCNLVCENPANKVATSPQTIPETTPQTTAESTPEKDHGVDAPAIPVNLEEWHDLIRKSEKNRQAVLHQMIEVLYPHSVVPKFSYISKVAKQVGGAGRLAELLWKAVGGRPSGDLLRYVQAMARNDTGPPKTEQELQDIEHLKSIVNT